MSRNASELCALLVEDVYGQLTSLLFRILLRYGRLSLPALRHHTCLSDRLVKHGLSVLVHHQLVLWYTSDRRWTTYEANPEAAFLLVRSGKYVKITEDRVGKFASGVISNLLFLGHAQVGDLVQAYGMGGGRSTKESLGPCGASGEPLPNESNPAANGFENDDVKPGSIHRTIRELLLLGLVSQVNKSHFRSDADNRIEAEKVVPPIEHYKAKSKRENEAQWEMSIEKQLNEWKYGVGDEIMEVDSMDKRKKRLREDTEDLRPGKRQRFQTPSTQQVNGTVGGTCRTVPGDVGTSDDTTILRINHHKFAVIMRNVHLIKVAGQSICETTSKVYSEVLRALEPNTRKCKKDTDALNDFEPDLDLTSLPQVTTDELVLMIQNTEELASALGSVEASSGDMAQDEHPKKRRKKEFDGEDEAIVNGAASSDEDEGDSNSDKDDSAVSVVSEEMNGEADYNPSSAITLSNNPHRERIRNHLLLLSRHPHKFLHHFPQTHILPERWSVDFPTLVMNVTQHTLMQTITARYGVPARRIVHILLEQGKVGEKELTAISLISQRTMRSYIARLHNSGMIQLQEIPRDLSRAPARTMYLWFFDVERSKAKISEETSKAMARCLQRVKVEGEKVKNTLEKANRSDVKGKEEQFLTIQEREALDKWRAVEDRIWGELGRLDDVIAIVCDY